MPTPDIQVNFNPFFHFFNVFFWAFVIAGFSMLLMLFWQTPIERAGNTIVTQPLMSGAIGLVSVLVGLILFLTILPPILVAFAWLFGVVAMGREVGERFATAINCASRAFRTRNGCRPRSPASAARTSCRR